MCCSLAMAGVAMTTFYVSVIFSQLYYPIGISPKVNSGRFLRGKPAATGRQGRATQPTVPVGCLSVSIIHRTLTWTTGIFNVHTHGNACDRTRRCTDTRKKKSALKVDSGRKIPFRTRESNLRQRRADPTLYQRPPSPQQEHNHVKGRALKCWKINFSSLLSTSFLSLS